MKISTKIVTVLVPLAMAVAASAQGLTLITPTNTTWRYFTNGADPGAGWALPGFDDNAWPQDRGLFGTETANVYPYEFATVIPLPRDGGPLTSYFRTHFPWNGGPFGVVLSGTNHIDDGCVVYLNGVEITRFNMPAGVPEYSTLAPVANPGGFPNLSGGEPVRVKMEIPLDNLTNGNANPLVNGDNVLAVEVHNQAFGSSDVVFGLSLFGGQCVAPCTDGIQPTNRTILEGRSTTFIVDLSENCGFPTPTFQWYRNVGSGEELIPGATASTYTLTNVMYLVDEGIYYCRLTRLGACSGTVYSRQAVLTILPDDQPPRFLSASVVGPGLNAFRLVTDEPLCGNGEPPPAGCGSDYSFPLNWQILQSDDPSIDLIVAAVTQINPTTYEFTTVETRDPTKRYQITVFQNFGAIGDLFGNLVSPGTFAETYTTIIFQQGVAGYTGTQDAEIHSNASANTPLGAGFTMKADLDDAGIAQSLLRFDNIFGVGTNRIPLGSRIVSATLTLNQVDPGTPVNLHRMLIDWDQSIATWNSFVDGVAANDLEAMMAIDATVPTSLLNGRIDLDVTASVQAWANGQANLGWALLPTGTDGVTFNTSESGVQTAPLLTVAHDGGEPCAGVTIFAQPPAFLFPAELASFTLAVGVSNAFGVVFQWTKGGVDIPGANQPSYTVQSASSLDAGTYRLRISCPFGVVVAMSNPSVVRIGDNFPPYLTGATAESDGVTITLSFSKPLNAASAQNLTNYTFTPPLAVLGAVLSNGNYVVLTTASRELSPNYTFRIANVSDTSTLGTMISPNPTLVTLTSARVILPWDADGWLYNTNNLDGTPDWKEPAFVPGADWRSGSGLFGAESSASVLAAAPAPIATPLIPNNVAAESEQRVTTYFRRTIDLPPLPASTRYVIRHFTDDGFIAYLDGVEIHRFAMPAGAVTFTNRSTGIPTGDATMRSFSFTATPGLHTLAVELHQTGVTSADVLFGMEVRMVGGVPPSLSISHGVNAGVNLNWDADNNWRLRGAVDLSGPYLDVAIPPGSRLGTFTLPAALVTNRSFWLLDYTGHP